MNFIKDLDAKRRRGLSNGKKDVHDIVGGTEVSALFKSAMQVYVQYH